jgi:preprotein translocase subunit SecG
MLSILLSTIYVLICFLLVVVVLMQAGKGGGISGAFGLGGASQTIFGASGAGNALTRATSILGAAFMLLSLLLALLSGSQPVAQRRSVLQPTGTSAPPVPGSSSGSLPGEVAPQGGQPGGPGGTGSAPAPEQVAPGGTGTAPAPAGQSTGTSGGTGN